MKVSIAPVAMMKGTIFVAISSKSEKNGSSQHSGLMATIRASGQFPIHDVVTVCADCRRNGISSNCMHAPRPPWKKTGNQARKTSILMQGDERTRARELDNEELEGLSSPAFDHEKLAWLEKEDERWMYTRQFSKDTVFIGVDPAAGGERSKYAIVSGVFHRESARSPKKLIVRDLILARSCSCLLPVLLLMEEVVVVVGWER